MRSRSIADGVGRGPCGVTKNEMSWYSSVTDPWVGIGSGDYKPAVGIRNLECVQMQVVQCFAIVATRGTQKPSPERALVIPSRTQVLMLVIRDESQVTQAELRNDTGDLLGHRKQDRGQAGVLPGGAPSDDERISHQLNCPLAWEQAHRASWPALPGAVALCSLPPSLVPELDISEQKRTSTCPPTCRWIQSYPKVPVDPHHIRQGARVAFPGHLRRLRNESLVEFVNQLETGAAPPARGHE